MLRIGDIEFFDNACNINYKNGVRAEVTKRKGESGNSEIAISFFDEADDNVTEEVDDLVTPQYHFLTEDKDEIVTDDIRIVLEYLSAAG